jgi:hypothetical protein
VTTATTETVSPATTPSAKGGLTTLEPILAESRQGVCVLLSCHEPDNAMSLGALAVRALRAIVASPEGKLAPIITAGETASGNPPDALGTGFPHAAFGEHERGWIDAGGLFETILAADPDERNGVTHVFCLDPWAAGLVASAKSLYPSANWIFISDLDSRRQCGESAYWDEYRHWISRGRFAAVLPARSLLRYLPDGFWAPGDAAPLKAALTIENPARMTFLIDEAEDEPPTSGVLHSVLKQRASDSRVILISPHLPFYRARHGKALEGCAAAFDPRNLSVGTYTALLQCADIYLAPGRLPFGPGPLGALARAKEVHLESRDETGLPDGLLGKVMWHDRHSRSQGTKHVGAGTLPATREQPKAAPSIDEVINTDIPPATPTPLPTFETWWKQLGSLGRKPATAPACDLSILTCCYKYLQRFRIFLDSIARQDHPVGRIEVCVAAPGNPDGLLEYLDLFRRAHPGLAVRVAEVPETDRTNRGKMINAAFRVSSAPVVMAADGDIILPPDFVRTVLSVHAPDRVIGCWRAPLDGEVTANLVTGNLDFQALFEAMRGRWSSSSAPDVRQGVLGYCQIVSREAFAAVMYPEDFNSINQSDIVFLDRLRDKLGVAPLFMDKLFVLHLDHPRDWSGTKVFL